MNFCLNIRFKGVYTCILEGKLYLNTNYSRLNRRLGEVKVIRHARVVWLRMGVAILHIEVIPLNGLGYGLLRGLALNFASTH